MNTTIKEYINSRNPWMIALFFLFFNLFLKTIGIVFNSIGQDEAWHIFYSIKPFDQLIHHALKDPNPPLYNILVGKWINFFGLNEVSMRYFSVFFSSMAALAIFFVGRKLYNNTVGILAALFFSFSTMNIYYGQEARVYGLEVFLVSIYFLALFSLLRSETKWKYFVILSVINILIIYTHLTPVFMFVIQGVFGVYFLLAKQNKNALYLIVSSIIPILAFLPWYFVSEFFHAESVGSWIPFPDWNEIDFITNELFNANYGKYLLLVSSFFTMVYYSKMTIEKAFLLAVIFFGIGLNLLATLKIGIFLSRYLIYTTVAGCLVLAIFSNDISSLFKKFKYLVILIPFFVWYKGFNLYPIKFEKWREISAEMKKLKSKYNDASFIITPSFLISPTSFYYDRDAYKKTEAELYDEMAHYGLYYVNETQYIPEKAFEKNDLFYLAAHKGVMSPEPFISYIQRKEYKKINSINFGEYYDGEILHFRKNVVIDSVVVEMPAIQSEEEYICAYQWDVAGYNNLFKIVAKIDMDSAHAKKLQSGFVFKTEQNNQTISHDWKPLSSANYFEWDIPNSENNKGLSLKAFIHNTQREKISVDKVVYVVYYIR